MSTASCRVCGSEAAVLRGSKPERLYFHCGGCDCVFLDPTRWLDAQSEKDRYCLHRNEATPEYEAFLGRLANPLLQILGAASSEGLDFGCGPHPVLAALFERNGHKVKSYDPIFFPQASFLESRYDFITCSEAAEHFHEPLKEFQLLDRLIKPQGHLAVMTQMKKSWDGFFDWYYPRDPTHVVFYSPRTMRWLAHYFDWELRFFPENTVIFQKAARSAGSANSDRCGCSQ